MPLKLKALMHVTFLKWKLSHFFSHEKVWLFDKDHNPSLKRFWNLNPLEIRTRWKTRIPSFEILNKLSQLIENDLDYPWATRNHPHCLIYRIFFGQPKNELHTLHGLQNKNSTIQGWLLETIHTIHGNPKMNCTLLLVVFPNNPKWSPLVLEL